MSVLIALAFLPLLIVAAFYSILSYGIYHVAFTCGDPSPGLAWVPFARYVCLAKAADEISVRRGVDTRYRVKIKVGLWGMGISFALIMVVALAFALVAPTYTRSGIGERWLFLLIPVMLTFFSFTVVYFVLFCMSAYRVYERFVPDNAAMFLVLSILFPVTQPFFMLACGNAAKRERIPRIGL